MIPQAVISATVSAASADELKIASAVRTFSSPAHQTHNDLRHQHQRSFRSGQQARNVVARQVELRSPGRIDRTIGHHKFEAEHVVCGDSVSQRMRTAGILGDVAADGAGALAGGIRGIKETVRFHGSRQVQIHHPRLNHRAFIGNVDFKNPVHAREGNHHASRKWNGSAAESRARSPPDNRNLVLRRKLYNRRDLFGGTREKYQFRPRLIVAGVVFVKSQVVRTIQKPARPDDFFSAWNGNRSEERADILNHRFGSPVDFADHFLDYFAVLVDQIALRNLNRAIAVLDGLIRLPRGRERDLKVIQKLPVSVLTRYPG